MDIAKTHFTVCAADDEDVTSELLMGKTTFRVVFDAKMHSVCLSFK